MNKNTKNILTRVQEFLNHINSSFYKNFISDFNFEKYKNDQRLCGDYFISQIQKTFKKYETYKDTLIAKNINVSEIIQDKDKVYFTLQLLKYQFKISINKKEETFCIIREIDFCKLIDYSHFSKLGDPKFEFSTNSSNENVYSIRCNRKFISDFFTHYFENIFKMMLMDYNELIKAPKIHFRRIIFDYKI